MTVWNDVKNRYKHLTHLRAKIKKLERKVHRRDRLITEYNYKLAQLKAILRKKDEQIKRQADSISDHQVRYAQLAVKYQDTQKEKNRV